MQMLYNALKWDERYWALGATGSEAARYRLGAGQTTWQNLRKAKFWQDPLRANTRRSLREALCAEETEAGSGGAASELDGVCTAALARTKRTIHFIGDVGKHLFAKAHLLCIEVLEGSETSLLPPGFGKKLAAKGVPATMYGPNVKYTLARLSEEAAPLREWRYTCIRLYTPREDLLFTSKKPEQLTTQTLCAILVTPGSIARHPPYAATNLDWRSSSFRWLPGLLAGGLVVPSAPELPAIVVMFSALRKLTQVYGMAAALMACLRGWLLRLWVPDAWGVGTDSVKQNLVPAVQQYAREPAADLQADGELWQAGTQVNAQQLRLLDKNLRHEVKAAEKLDHKRRKLVLKQREKDELAAAEKSLKETSAKVVDHRQGSPHQTLLDGPFGAPTTLENRTVRGGFTVDSQRVSPEAASSSTFDLGVHVPPTDLEPAFHAVSADATPAHANKEAKSKTTAKTGAKGQTEQTTLTQMDLEARVEVQSIDKAQRQAIVAQIEAANNAGCGGRGAPGLKRKPKAQALTIPSVPQLEQASWRTRSAKQ